MEAKRYLFLSGIIILIAGLVPNVALSRTYRSELRRVTERGKLYDGKSFDAKLIWNATLVTDDFRRARAKKYSSIHRLGAVEAARFIASEETEQQKTWDFFLHLYASPKYEHLSSTSSSFWEVTLQTESGEEMVPIAIELVPVSPEHEVLYPHIDRWSKAYRVVFPKADLGRKVRLTLSSVVGNSTLTWRLPEQE